MTGGTNARHLIKHAANVKPMVILLTCAGEVRTTPERGPKVHIRSPKSTKSKLVTRTQKNLRIHPKIMMLTLVLFQAAGCSLTVTTGHTKVTKYTSSRTSSRPCVTGPTQIVFFLIFRPVRPIHSFINLHN